LRRPNVLTTVLLLQILAGAPTFAAGPYSDELSKCLVRSTTQADKSMLVQWFVSVCTLHPDVKWMSNVTDAKRAELNKNTAQIFERLLTSGCTNEARDAVKYEGTGAIESSFSVLGQVAARELFSNPSVATGLSDFGKALDLKKIEKALTPEK
jgi:hypothetical protein